MDNITIEKLNELFIDTLEKCSSRILQKDDDEIEYDLFEEFDIGMRSFLHEESLNRLLSENYINKEIMILSKKLRETALAIDEDKWNLEEAKTTKEWADIFYLSDRILEIKLDYDKNNLK